MPFVRRLCASAALHAVVSFAAAAQAAAATAPAQAPPPDAPAVWEIAVRADRHSDPLPLADLESEEFDRLRARSGRNLAYIEDEIRASRTQGAWTWSLLARSSATLVVNQDGMELAAQVARVVPADRDRLWNAEADFRAFNGAGVETARTFALARAWHAGVSVQALSIARWREREIDGTVSYEAATRGYRFDARSSEISSRLDFPFRQSFSSSGQGLLLGGTLEWRSPQLTLGLSMRDLGWLRWRGVPRDDARLSSFTQSYDADGFVVYKPLIQGQYSQAGSTVRLAPKWTLSGRWQSEGHGRFELATDWLPDFGALPSVGWGQRFGAVDLGLGWRFHERRATLSLAWQGLRLRFGADRLGSGAHSRDVALGWAFSF